MEAREGFQGGSTFGPGFEFRRTDYFCPALACPQLPYPPVALHRLSQVISPAAYTPKALYGKASLSSTVAPLAVISLYRDEHAIYVVIRGACLVVSWLPLATGCCLAATGNHAAFNVEVQRLLHLSLSGLAL